MYLSNVHRMKIVKLFGFAQITQAIRHTDVVIAFLMTWMPNKQSRKPRHGSIAMGSTTRAVDCSRSFFVPQLNKPFAVQSPSRLPLHRIPCRYPLPRNLSGVLLSPLLQYLRLCFLLRSCPESAYLLLRCLRRQV
jgi:hypothetical protein